MPSALDIVHLLTPGVLALPVFSLLQLQPPAAQELPGIRPVTIRTVTPRRGWILFTLSALASTSAMEAAVLIADLITAHRRGVAHSQWFVLTRVVHSLGGLCVWFLAAIFAEWRTRWGDRALILLAFLAFGLEIPNLVLTVIQEVHARASDRIFAILCIPPSALRLLILPVLVVLVLAPIVRFEPASEATGLLEDGGTDGATSTAREAGPTYGTFQEDGSRETSLAPRTAAGTPVPDAGAAGRATSPSGVQKQINIPKKLGQKQEPMTGGISWTEFWARLWKLRAYLWPSTSAKLQFFTFICIILLLIGRFVNPLVPLSLGKLVDILTTVEGDVHKLPPVEPPSPWKYLMVYVGLRAFQGSGFLGFLQNVLWVQVQQYADREMQLLLFNHLLDLSLAFHTKRNTGEVLKIIDRGSAINNLLQILLFSAAPTICDIVIVTFVLYFTLNGTLAIVIGAVMLSYITFSVIFTSYRTALRREMRDRDIKTRGIASDVLTNWESVKFFTAESRETSRFRDSILSYQETEKKVLISFNFLNLVQSFIITLGLLGGSLIIANRIMQGQSKTGDFVLFVAYLQQIYAPLDRIGTLYRQLNQNATEAEKLFNLLSLPTEIKDEPGAKDLVITDGVIEFDNVWFSYDGTVDALKGISFRIGKGESMALVGESGSGKSTILRLLYRFYDINSGQIRIDGQDISKVKQSSLRRAIGIVPQDSVLWNDTIGANISYGKEGAGDAEIIAAAYAARLHDRILTFPEGYATTVGERGVRLSGGEKQRVSLARMFLKSPAILVLDEATSALDTETEREIQKALAELSKGRSSLSIAHRLSTIINSDQIVVMKEGNIIEHGSYRELVALKGSFATMWKKQIHTEDEMRAVAAVDRAKAAELQMIDISEEEETTPTPHPARGDGETSGLQVPMEAAAAAGDFPEDTSGYAVSKPDESKEEEPVEATAGEAESDETKPDAAKASEEQPDEAQNAWHKEIKPDEATAPELPKELADPQPLRDAPADPEPPTDLDEAEPACIGPPAPTSSFPASAFPDMGESQPETTSPQDEPKSPRSTTFPTFQEPESFVGPDPTIDTPHQPVPTYQGSSAHEPGRSLGRSPPPADEASGSGGKTKRKRLKSLKAFGRRMSDQMMVRSLSEEEPKKRSRSDSKKRMSVDTTATKSKRPGE